MLNEFAAAVIRTTESSIFVRSAGSGPPILLLHGFPETHLMWRSVAPILAGRFTVVCADLRGYGASGCPVSTPDHSPYSKRAMARELVAVMQQLGFPRFAVAGHDRGGRVAYRMALDHPDRVERLAVLDILPTGEMWDRADAKFAGAFWPWSLLAQPEPLPERLLLAAPDAVIDDALGGWGSPSSIFGAEVRTGYIEALKSPAHVHAICEEYRAAATRDREDDTADRRAGRRIECPLLALWSGRGPLGSWYSAAGGPLAIWRAWADDVRGGPLDAGHFFPEEVPERTATALQRFCAADR
ncbi:MAG: alpha/beta hydrolase [Hyphomicrobiales bacterium]|nr:alpha/beta hydrolase [Hyphomicrobiales bacterium]MBV8442694.1 alpha/beta hydrolase [Hyphomicrobiales bacterium]